MDILVRLIEEKIHKRKMISKKETISKEDCTQNIINKIKIVKIFLIINIVFIILAFISNGCILYVQKILSYQESFYGIKNKENVKLCFIVSSVLFLLLIVLFTFLYPFYNYFKECEIEDEKNNEK
jgi:hypothetical protein